jgi:hypothetical protein
MNALTMFVCAVLCSPFWIYYITKFATLGFYVGRHRATKLIRKLSQ